MEKIEVAILGGGISGLSLGWFLKQRGVNAIIFEKDQRVGGWMRTEERDGFLFERGPHSLRSYGAGEVTLALVKDLGLEDALIFASRTAVHRYLYLDEKLQKLPSSLKECLFSPIMRGSRLGMFHDLIARKGTGEDESIDAFAKRRFSEKIALRFFDPLTLGIFAGDLGELSIKGCFPHLFEMEQKYRSLILGMMRTHVKKERPPLFSFKQGVEQLSKRLGDELSSQIRLGCEVKKLIPKKHGIELTTSNGSYFASHVFTTLPPKEGVRKSIGVVNLGYRKKLGSLQGFGYLIPSSEKEAVLGCVWDSAAFPEQNQGEQTRLTVMIDSRVEEKQLLKTAIEGVKKQMGITAYPDQFIAAQVKNAIPQYTVGHVERVKKIEKEAKKRSPHLTCLGSHLYGVAVNECIAKSLEVSKKWNPV